MAAIELSRKWRPLGQILADTLDTLSLDVVDIAASYCVSRAVTPYCNVQTILTRNIAETHSPEGCCVMACSSEGHIWMSDDSQPEECRLQVYDGVHGTCLFAVPVGIHAAIRGIAFDTNGEVYVTDLHNRCVVVYSTRGDLRRVLSSSTNPELHFLSPSGVVVDGGLVFVADSITRSIHVMDRYGNLVRIMNRVHGMVVNDTYRILLAMVPHTSGKQLYVFHTEKHTMRVLDVDEKNVPHRTKRPLRKFGLPWSIESFTLDRAGNILVTNSSRNCVDAFAPDGTFLVSIQTGLTPLAACVDKNGYVYVYLPGRGGRRILVYCFCN